MCFRFVFVCYLLCVLTAAACFRLPQQGAQTSGNCFRWEIKEMLSAERQIDQLHHPAVPEPEAFICFLSSFFFLQVCLKVPLPLHLTEYLCYSPGVRFGLM